MSEDAMRDTPIRHRWALVRFADALMNSEDDEVRFAAGQLLDELRTERYRGEFDAFDTLIARSLRGEDGA